MRAHWCLDRRIDVNVTRTTVLNCSEKDAQMFCEHSVETKKGHVYGSG